MSDKKGKLKVSHKVVPTRDTIKEISEKTVLKSLGQCSFTRNSDPSAVDVRNGKILRIRP
jgi:hypothetical protein